MREFSRRKHHDIHCNGTIQGDTWRKVEASNWNDYIRLKTPAISRNVFEKKLQAAFAAELDVI